MPTSVSKKCKSESETEWLSIIFNQTLVLTECHMTWSKPIELCI
jgi:hypothetical protein